MYYILGEKGLEHAGQKEWEKSKKGVGVFDQEEWGKELLLREEFSIEPDPKDIFFCRLENNSGYLFCTLHIPIKRKAKRHNAFIMYVLPGKIIFVDDGESVKEAIEKIRGQSEGKEYSIDKFLGEFLMSFIEEDTLYLAELERTIAEMEERVLKKDTTNFNYDMLKMKKEISRFYCYYGQMINLGEALCESDADFLNLEDNKGYQIFMERCERLQQEIQVLREYAMQVQDVYQSEIEIRQNGIMKLLTIVTTIFLPLTLIAGWYGMNFKHMPELEWVYSYPVVIGVSVLVVVMSLYYFKKKKFL